jgi:predicted transcriptional regulator
MPANHQLIPKVVKLDIEVKDRLERLGKLKNRSPHWLMKEAIVRYLKQEENNERLKQETINSWKEIEKGNIVSHKSVSAWLDTWGTEEEGKRPPCGS